MKEIMVKTWKVEQEQAKACNYGANGFDYSRRDADNFNQATVVDGYNFLAVEILKETEKAIYVDIDMTWKCWLPKSTVKEVA